MKKAQVSLEMILAISLVILIFLGFYIFYLDKNRDLKNLNEILDLRNECFKISNAIGHAITLGDGYNTRFSLSINTTIRITEGVINIENRKGTDRVSTSCSYRGDVTSGTYNRTINITNTNNVITIQNA